MSNTVAIGISTVIYCQWVAIITRCVRVQTTAIAYGSQTVVITGKRIHATCNRSSCTISIARYRVLGVGLSTETGKYNFVSRIQIHAVGIVPGGADAGNGVSVGAESIVDDAVRVVFRNDEIARCANAGRSCSPTSQQ